MPMVLKLGGTQEQLNKSSGCKKNNREKNNGCQKITIIESPKNKGLADSVIGGVSDILNKYEKVIVIERRC